ncbi:MAG TPA: PAS domain-containing sensor histidine kinase [Spirochaetes bacterium]|nr:PAS domain-containing sensor histidine kinase [Spirochaetota bacterium]
MKVLEVGVKRGDEGHKSAGELPGNSGEMGKDPDELRRSQVELEESRRRCSELFDFAPVGYFVTDKKGIITKVNLTGALMLGVERGLIINMPFINYIAKDDRDLLYRHTKKIYDSGEGQSCELRLVRKDVSVFFARMDSKLFENPEDGQVVRTTLTDVTVMKNVERVLEKRTRDLGERVKELECLYGIYRIAGEAGASMIKIVKGIVDLVPHGFQYPEIICARIILDGEEFRTENFKETDKKFTAGISLIGQPDGLLEVCCLEEKPEYDEGPFLNEEKKLISAVAGHVSVVAQRKQLEDQVEIRERMDWLATLAGGIAHDFNNLLTGILGNVSLILLDDELTDKQKSYISNIESSGNRAASLVKQFQTLSKGSVSERVCIDLYRVSKEVFKLLEETTNRLIKKQLEMAPDEFYVVVSPAELNQVLLNLGVNAVEAIEERGAKQGDYIRIAAKNYISRDTDRTGLPAGKYIHILFEDNGMGMSDDVQKRVFDPFFSTKEMGDKKGQGLGLAMVYNIVTRNMNGFIDIESVPGEGTRFHIYLPEEKLKIKSDEETEEIITGNETILLIEDEDTVRDMLVEILQKQGYRVLSAADGRIGIDIFSENKDRIDLVMLDLMMPVMSGRSCFGTIKGIKKDVKVLISTGQKPVAAEEGVLSKANGVIFKPYNGRDLLIKLREILDS